MDEPWPLQPAEQRATEQCQQQTPGAASLQSVAGSAVMLLWRRRRHFCNLLGWLLAMPPIVMLRCVLCGCLLCSVGLLRCRSLRRNELTVLQQRTHLKCESSKQRCRA